jgi:BR serine/threonine kinase
MYYYYYYFDLLPLIRSDGFPDARPFRMLRPAPQVGDYVLQGTLGTGSTGKVKLAEHKVTGRKVAIKIIRKTTVEDQPDLAIKIRREISLMRLLNHPHLLGLVEVCESGQHLYIILEYAEHGELFDYLASHGSLSVEEGMNFFRQIIYGLEFLHLHGICHRDLKPENILLDNTDNIKIADFGFARWMRHSQADTSCGSPHYAAPEIVKGETYDGRRSDIWSAGVILYTLLSGTLPFDDTSIRALLQKVKLGQYRMPDFPPPIKELIQRMLEVEPSKRITIAQIKESEAFREGFPEGYVLPSPLPIPQLTNPIDPATLKKSTLDTMCKLGYENKSELFADLLSTEHNMAKVFVVNLTEGVPLDSLPWKFGERDGNEELPADNSQFMFQGTPAWDSPGVGRALAKLSGSVIGGSMVEPLLGADDPEAATATRQIEVHVRLERLMFALQDFLDRSGLAWFHPHEKRLIARSRSDTPVDVSFDALTDINGDLSLQINLVSGPADQFVAICDCAAQAVAAIIDD